MKERAYAKINLCLDVVGKREDGYHELEMVMVPVSFYDMLEMKVAPKTTLSNNREYIPVNDKNTIIKAIDVMREKYGFTENFACNLQKHIPTRAGLAGGSADAAAAIRMMNRMLDLKMAREDMIEVAKKVGADVPFCLFEKPSLVKGIGEVLTPFEVNTDFEILLVKPRKGVSTKEAFDICDSTEHNHPDCMSMIAALENDDYEGVIANLGNSLEAAALQLVPEIRQVKEALSALGFDGVLMSGSGSTVFGITRDKELGMRAEQLLKNKKCFTRLVKII